MTATVWDDEITGLVAARFDYDPGTVARLKAAIPRGSRQWDPNRRLWLIDPPYRAAAQHVLGLDRPRRRPTMDAVVAALFDGLPEHLREPTFKALMRVWHPDIGGDTQAAQALNVWRQRQAS